MKPAKRNKLTIASLLLSTCFLLVPGAQAQDKVIAAKDVEWGYLNPARGDKSPGAADLWGERTKDTATGMLVRFNKGFESPPHIHNVTYRGVVIRGEVHNDASMAMARCRIRQRVQLRALASTSQPTRTTTTT